MNQEKPSTVSKQKPYLTDYPCLAEKRLVDKCYDRTRCNRQACAMEIENFKACKNFWGMVTKERRRAHILPAKPDAEERERIKAYYKIHGKLPDFKPPT